MATTTAQLTPRQSEVLDFLREQGPASSRRVAGHFDGWSQGPAAGMRSQDAGRVLEALRRKGFVEYDFTRGFEYRAV